MWAAVCDGLDGVFSCKGPPLGYFAATKRSVLAWHWPTQRVPASQSADG